MAVTKSSRLIVLGAIVTSVVPPLQSQQARSVFVPPPVLAGLRTYEDQGARAALDVWLNGSSVATDADLRNSILESLRRIRQHYGLMKGYEILKAVWIGCHVVRTYVTILHERGPVFAYFDAYKGDQWLISGLLFNTQPSAILPAELLVRPQPSTPNDSIEIVCM
jgi:hypothetical protein